MVLISKITVTPDIIGPANFIKLANLEALLRVLTPLPAMHVLASRESKAYLPELIPSLRYSPAFELILAKSCKLIGTILAPSIN